MAAPCKKHAPLGRLIFEKSSFEDSNDNHQRCISDHYFNSSIHVLCPNLSAIPSEVDNILSSQMSYLARNVSLPLLLSMEFIEGFVKRGNMYMLSHGTCIDLDDCVALLPTGTLVLNLSKDTFQSLGLEGKPAKYGTVHVGYQKYVVEIDLRDKKFFPKMKYYERVKWCLSERLNLTFDFLLSWEPSDSKVCPSSIQTFFQSNECLCNRISIPKTTTRYENFKVPLISPDVVKENATKKKSHPNTGADDVIDQSDTYCSYLEVFDWLGACANCIEMDNIEIDDDYITSFSCPTPNEVSKYGSSLEYRGLITPHTVQAVVNHMRTLMEDKSLPWCCVSVHGFMDSPVTWKNYYHGFFNSGDNLYSLLMFKNGMYWLYRALGGKDIVT